MKYKIVTILSTATILLAEQAASQDIDGDQSEISSATKEIISIIERDTGKDIRIFLSEVVAFEPIASSDAVGVLIPKTPSLEPKAEVDFGYAVIDGSGEPIDLFGPNTPVVFTADQSRIQEIKGYITPENATIQLVGKIEYDKVNGRLVEEMREASKTSATGVTIGQVGQKAQQATTALLIEICPQPYYAEGLTLYMNAGLDFVVFNTGTGTELSFNFTKQCASFLNFLELEAKRRGLIPQ